MYFSFARGMLYSAVIVAVAGCATNEQGQTVVDGAKVNAVVAQIFAPQPIVVVAQPVQAVAVVQPNGLVEETYVVMPQDTYLVNATEADLVFVSGNTYIWTVDERGHRYRRFYAHGNHRDELLHRREELHHVMERHGGHLPEHDRNGKPVPGGKTVASQSAANKAASPSTGSGTAGTAKATGTPATAKAATPKPAAPAATKVAVKSAPAPKKN